MLDDIDHEAAREGSAMSRLRGYTGLRRSRVVVRKNDRKSVKTEDVDVLRILNIIHGPPHEKRKETSIVPG